MTEPRNMEGFPRIYDNSAGEAFLSTLSTCLVGLDDGLIYYATESLEEMFGYGVHGELLGHHVEMLIPDELRQQHVADRENYSLKPVPRPMGHARGIVKGIRKDRTVFNVAVSLGKSRMLSGVRLVPAVVLDNPYTNQQWVISLKGEPGNEKRRPIGRDDRKGNHG